MSLISTWLAALRERKNKALFKAAIRGVRNSLPIRLDPSSSLTVVSMVHHRDILPYLLAIKSFCRQVLVGRVVLVADPSLTGDDRKLVGSHVVGLEIRDAAAVGDPRVPTGGTWERLALISDLVSEGYVIQLDSDTVSVGGLEEVTQAVRDNTSFVLCSADGQRIQSCTEASAVAGSRSSATDHIQGVAESRLGVLEPLRLKYIRGCSGFSGFAKGSTSRDQLAQISMLMQGVVGSRWTEWGTEQVTSNIICASAQGARPLPHPKYCNAHYSTPESRFLHFIGYTRYRDTLYGAVSRRVIDELVRH